MRVITRNLAMVVAGLVGLAGLSASASAEMAVTPPVSLEALKAKYQRPTSIPFPADNAFTKDRELLGRTLFFDPRLSSSNWISCATCHNPALAWGDGLPKAIGHGMGVLGRRTPTILNLAWTDLLFWDGRAEGLEGQALGPIESPGEMNQKLEELPDKLARIEGYRHLFQMAYPGEGITTKTIARAIATFERTVVSGLAPFDHWIAGKADAISESAKRGFQLFNTKANCVACHTGWNFSDGGFHDVGLPSADLGRGKLLPNLVRMQHAFKTPTLRNVDRRAPYMHNGSLATLAEVIDFYDKGGAVRPSKSLEMKALGLTAQEKSDLVELMKTLTSVDAPVIVPELPR
jgi:cytochrome c peroxidase